MPIDKLSQPSGNQPNQDNQWDSLHDTSFSAEQKEKDSEEQSPEQKLEEIRAQVRKLAKSTRDLQTEYIEEYQAGHAERVAVNDRAAHEALANMDLGAALKYKRLEEQAFSEYEKRYKESFEEMEKAALRNALYYRSPQYYFDTQAFTAGLTGDSKDAAVTKTIEATSGEYYKDRAERLRGIIEKFGGEDKQEDLDFLDSTPSVVTKYARFLTQDPSADDYVSYDVARTRAHNSLIKQLNHLNELAEKYFTSRFTVRNFITTSALTARSGSAAARSENARKYSANPAISDRQLFDRRAVKSYFLDYAFPKKLHQIEDEQND